MVREPQLKETLCYPGESRSVLMPSGWPRTQMDVFRGCQRNASMEVSQASDDFSRYNVPCFYRQNSNTYYAGLL